MNMRLWQDGIIALLAAIGLASLVWMAVRSLFFRTPAAKGTTILLCARGNGEELEQQVRTLSLLCRENGTPGTILLADCGLSEEGMRLCRLLERSNRRVVLCKISEIEKYIS